MAELVGQVPIIMWGSDERWKKLPFGNLRNKTRKAEYSKRWLQHKKSYINDYNKSWTPILKDKVFAIFGGKCQCGYSDSRALQIDHIKGCGGKDQLKGHGANTYYRRLLKLHSTSPEKFFSTYQLLCANCNWIKRVEEKELYKH